MGEESDSSPDTCPVCLDDLEQEVLRLPCGHRFHRSLEVAEFLLCIFKSNRKRFRAGESTGNIWGVPTMGVPLNHPFIDGFFHEVNHGLLTLRKISSMVCFDDLPK